MALEIGAGITIGPGITVTSPAGGGGSGAPISGTFTLGAGMGRYTTYSGTESVTPTGIIREIAQNGGSTLFYLNQGTFGSVTVTSSSLNGSSSITVTIDGVTQTLSGPVDFSGVYTLWEVNGDPFSIYDFDTHTISIS